MGPTAWKQSIKNEPKLLKPHTFWNVQTFYLLFNVVLESEFNVHFPVQSVFFNLQRYEIAMDKKHTMKTSDK